MLFCTWCVHQVTYHLLLCKLIFVSHLLGNIEFSIIPYCIFHVSFLQPHNSLFHYPIHLDYSSYGSPQCTLHGLHLQNSARACWSSISFSVGNTLYYKQSRVKTLACPQTEIRKNQAARPGPSLYLTQIGCASLQKMQRPAKFTTYSLFTAGCCTCGFCIRSPPPAKSSVVPGLPSDMCSISTGRRCCGLNFSGKEKAFVWNNNDCFRHLYFCRWLSFLFPVPQLSLNPPAPPPPQSTTLPFAPTHTHP